MPPKKLKKKTIFNKARGRKVPGIMNQTETNYYEGVLLPKKVSGEYLDIRYEAVTLRLAPKTTYTPDFLVMTAEGFLELHEVKGGYTRDDARVKWKVAAELYPMFTWRLIQMSGKKIKKQEDR